jgi:hypothetical protein
MVKFLTAMGLFIVPNLGTVICHATQAPLFVRTQDNKGNGGGLIYAER